MNVHRYLINILASKLLRIGMHIDTYAEADPGLQVRGLT